MQTNTTYEKTIHSKARKSPVEAFKQGKQWARTNNKRQELVEAPNGFKGK